MWSRMAINGQSAGRVMTDSPSSQKGSLDAISEARTIAENQGSELFIHNRQGRDS